MSGARPRPEAPPNFYNSSGNPFAQGPYSATSTIPSNSDPRSGSNFGASPGPDEGGWARITPSMAVRSMSMIGHEELPSQYQNYSYATVSHSDLKRRPTNMSDVQTAPSLQGSGASSSTSTSDSFVPPSFPAYRGQPLSSQPAGYPGYPGWPPYPDPQHGAAGVSGGYGAGLYSATTPNQHHFNHMSQYKTESAQYPDLPSNYSGPS